MSSRRPTDVTTCPLPSFTSHESCCNITCNQQSIHCNASCCVPNGGGFLPGNQPPLPSLPASTVTNVGIDTAVSDTTDTYYEYCVPDQLSAAYSCENLSVAFRARCPAPPYQSHNYGRPSKFRKIYPIDGELLETDRIHQHQLQQHQQQSPPMYVQPAPRPTSRHSIGTMTINNAIVVDGCGGRCQTCENVCYFFLQLIFMMGVLIGVSLSIAGLVLRRSAARNLQVLVHIGVLLALVSGLLLAIQYNSRQSIKKRRNRHHRLIPQPTTPPPIITLAPPPNRGQNTDVTTSDNIPMENLYRQQQVPLMGLTNATDQYDQVMWPPAWWRSHMMTATPLGNL